MTRRTALKSPVVLLVEDEPLVRELDIDVLQESGFRVLEARTADEAFEILKSRPDVHVIFTDVDMPGSINGFEFARLVNQGWPSIPILVTSGKVSPSAGDLPPNASFLPKPFLPEVLARKLEQLVNETVG